MEAEEETKALTFDGLVRSESNAESSALLVLLCGEQIRVVSLEPGQPVTVGRGTDATVQFSDSSISRQHCQFAITGSEVWVEDLGSTNGTVVNGHRIQSQRLGSEDQVQMGLVTASLHMAARHLGSDSSILPHHRFMDEMSQAIERARGRRVTLAFIMVRPASRSNVGLSEWRAQLSPLLLPDDCVGGFSDNTIELLLVDSDEDRVHCRLEQVRSVPFSAPDQLCFGVAVFPGAARSADGLHAVVHSALRRATASEPIHWAPRRESSSWSGHDADTSLAGWDYVIASPAMQEIYRTAARIAQSEIPVLLLGETGVGKEVFARLIHDRSKRKASSLICVNCGAITETLLESKLFGHEKGAFTGADRTVKGVFEEAEGGTVLLDEVGELSPSAQVALLRVLETKTVTRVGAHRPIKINVRILAATNRGLESMSEEGRFRADLLFRLNAVTLEVPPLRERTEEVEQLCERFLEQANGENDCNVTGFTSEVLTLLRQYSWPGNIRELRNVIERAVVIARSGPIRVQHLTTPILEGARREARRPIKDLRSEITEVTDVASVEFRAEGSFKRRVQEVEQALIGEALCATDWNKAAAARRLGIPVRTLREKVRSGDINHLSHDSREARQVIEDLYCQVPGGTELSFWDLIRQYEVVLIREELQRNQGNKTQTARALRIPVETLKYKIKKHEIEL